MKHRRDKAQRTVGEPLCVGKERRRCERKWLFLIWILMQNWFCVDAAAGRLEPKGRGEVADNNIVSDVVVGTHIRATGWRTEPSSAERKTPEKWNRTNGVDKMEMRREEKRLRCALLMVRPGAQEGNL